jgi:hypothetical protein
MYMNEQKCTDMYINVQTCTENENNFKNNINIDDKQTIWDIRKDTIYV